MQKVILVFAFSLMLTSALGCGGGSNGGSQPKLTSLSLSGTTYDFGENIVANPASATVVTIANTGANPLTIAPTLSGDAGFHLVAGQSCGTQISAGASCNEVMTYTPVTASAPAQQTATLNLNPENVAAGTSATISITGTSGTLTAGTVTATNNPQVARYTITPPFAGTVTVNFGRSTSYGLNTSAQGMPTYGNPVTIFVAGMLQNTNYQMQASITFANGVTVTDVNHTFTTGSYAAGLSPQISATTAAGQTPQPGIEILNPCCSSPTLQMMATDLDGNLIWGYQPPETLSGGAEIFAPKLLPNGDFLFIIGPTSTTPMSGPIPASTPILAREIDLAGDTVRQVTLADLNSRLSTASCAECSGLTLQTFHHDITPLPNNHWLILANTLKTFTFTGQTAPTNVLGDVVIDVDEDLNPVWVWNEFNHLDINRQPYLFPDWTHTNAIVYSPSDGDIIVSIRHQNWVVKVNYNNGLGDGSVLWHLGEGGDFTLQGGTDPTDWFYAQHAPSFTTTNTSGTFGLTLMDNGDDRIFPAGTTCGTEGAPPCLYSTVPVFQLDEVAKTANITFHQILTSQYSNFGGNAEQLANGHLEYDLCGLGGSTTSESEVDEITQSTTPQSVWQMKLSANFFYRAYRSPSLYPGVLWSGRNF